MKQPWPYIVLGALTVFLLWQFTRVRTELVQTRAELRHCHDSLTAQRDTVTDTVYLEIVQTQYINVPVPTPVYVVDSVYLQPPLARYEDSVALDSSMTLYYRLNVRGSLLSQGYRYRGVFPEITRTEYVYLPAECHAPLKWAASAGAVYLYPDQIGIMGQVSAGRISAGYHYAGGQRHGVHLLYKIR